MAALPMFPPGSAFALSGRPPAILSQINKRRVLMIDD